MITQTSLEPVEKIKELAAHVHMPTQVTHLSRSLPQWLTFKTIQRTGVILLSHSAKVPSVSVADRSWI